MTLEKDLGTTMNVYRKQVLGVNQSEFGELIEKKQSDISDIERGEKLPNIDDLNLLYQKTKRPIYQVLALGLAVRQAIQV